MARGNQALVTLIARDCKRQLPHEQQAHDSDKLEFNKYKWCRLRCLTKTSSGSDASTV